MLIAINHHYIRNKYEHPYPGINGITPALFRDKLINLSAQGSFVSANDIADAVDGKAMLPKDAIVITFDDGLKEQYELALPVLNELGIPALFFINTINLEGSVSDVHKIHLLRSLLSPADFAQELKLFMGNESQHDIDLENAKLQGIKHYIYDEPLAAGIKYILNFMLPAAQLQLFTKQLFPKYFDEKKVAEELYMSATQVTALNELGYLGSHGHEHLPLAQLPAVDAGFQISRSQEVIKNITGNTVHAFSYPYGSEESYKGLSGKLDAAGFKFSFTMKRDANADVSDPFYLSRFDNNDMPLGKANKFPAHVNIFDHLKSQYHAG